MNSSQPPATDSSRVRFVTAVAGMLAGFSLGLAGARLLYETAPVRGSLWGGFPASLITAAVPALILSALFWKLGRSQSILTAASVPALIAWAVILPPSADVNPLREAILLGAAIILMLALLRPVIAGSPPRGLDIALAGAPALIAYLLTLQTTIGRADTFEFQVTAPVLGVAHPTGYPLYILLGKLFTLIPFANIATRVNLTSAVFATAAVMLLYVCLNRVLKIDALVAGLTALLFGLSPIFWSQAVVAEVYALHNAFVAAILALTLWLVINPDHPSTPRGVIALFALIGLSLTNHLTTVLVIPAVGVAIVLIRPRLSAKQWMLAFAAFAAALLIYLFIPLRWPALNEGRVMPFADFIGWITGSRFRGALQLRAWFTDPERWRIVARLLLDQFGWPGAILSIIGLVWLAWKRWRAALITALVFAAVAFYGLNYLVPDIGVFLIPMFLVGAIWIGCAVGGLIELVSKRIPSSFEPWIRAAAVTLLALMPLRAAWTVGPTFDWSSERALESWGRRVLNLPLVGGSSILADSEKIAPLEYLHRIEHVRPDVDMVVLGTEAEYLADLQTRLARGETVYLARFLPGLEGAYSLRSLGPLIEVGTAPLANNAADSALLAEWPDGLTLLNIQADNAFPHQGEETWLTLYWQARQPQIDNFHVHLRLVDSDGAVVWNDTPTFPVSNRYPPVAWKGAEVIPDFHAIPIPASLAPGTYTVEVSLGPPFSPDLLVSAEGTSRVAVGQVRVQASISPLPFHGTRRAVSFPGGALTGASADGQALPGVPVTLAANWRMGSADFQTQVVLSADGRSRSFAPPAEDFPRISAVADTGDSLRWRLIGDQLRCGWLQALSDFCELGRTVVSGPALTQSVANFENRILLTEVDFETGRLEPGQIVQVTLVWQAVQPLNEDYTVFVHLLGPDGRVHGQVDSWPVQGTYPTSDWPLNVPISDPYAVPLDPDAPSGSYQLEIGIYLLGTNTRLAVFDAASAAIDDKVLLPGLLLP